VLATYHLDFVFPRDNEIECHVRINQITFTLVVFTDVRTLGMNHPICVYKIHIFIVQKISNNLREANLIFIETFATEREREREGGGRVKRREINSE